MFSKLGLATRYYLPIEDINQDVLIPSETETRCPYKGIANYYSVKIGDELYEDIIWTYKDPLPAVQEIKGLLCFYSERIDALYIDGEKWDCLKMKAYPIKI